MVNTLQYSGWYTPLKLEVQADRDSSGFAEVVSLGQTSDGKKAWLSHDSYHHNQLAARIFPAWYQPSNIEQFQILIMMESMIFW
ncbi:hypothetical protein [Pseudoalteromonas spongiae]|uniref:hypothetical protein n=1 Tax=Pseudoalteromonas spongiae TaxID=298657 RepID=UPI00110B8BE7|nr:hypothetical protein [Pseudoalteromonas spongiae]TMO82180.1 hypothetical protein CWC15_20005 [Pseudoalteromonas spongiae]